MSITNQLNTYICYSDLMLGLPVMLKEGIGVIVGLILGFIIGFAYIIWRFG